MNKPVFFHQPLAIVKLWAGEPSIPGDKLREIKWEIEKPTVTVGDLDIHFWESDKTTRKSIKAIELKNITNQ